MYGKPQTSRTPLSTDDPGYGRPTSRFRSLLEASRLGGYSREIPSKLVTPSDELGSSC
jgi:hypothetical protein